MTGILYYRDDKGVFREVPALQGKEGSQGRAGNPGSVIYNGTNITGTATYGTIFPNSGVANANTVDYYLNTQTCNFYQCVSPGAPSKAQWKFICSLRGDYINEAEVTKDSGELILQSNQGVQLLAGVVRGENGHTPEKGTDYWTDGDIAEIKGYVDDAILGGEW